MINRDLAAARDKWIEEAKKPAEKMKRLKSDFLSYRNDDGLYADFHGLRHWFITGLARAGISPKMAQTLAQHADVRLTPVRLAPVLSRRRRRQRLDRRRLVVQRHVCVQPQQGERAVRFLTVGPLRRATPIHNRPG